MYAHWQGGLDPKWGGMLSVDPNNPIRVVKDPGGNETSLTGSIINDLPGTLTNVTIIWIKNSRGNPPTYERSIDSKTGNMTEWPWVPFAKSGLSSAIGVAWRTNAQIPFTPQSAINLSGIGQTEPLSKTMYMRYANPFDNHDFNAPITVNFVTWKC